MATKYKLQSSDKEVLEAEEKVVKMSVTLRTMLADLGGEDGAPSGDDDLIPIQNVTASVLKKVLAWCEQHKDDPAPVEDEDHEKRSDEIPAWDKTFLEVDQSTLFEIILAANYLDIKGLLDVACKSVAHMIRGKTPQQIRDQFGIINDFTKEEEDRIRKENEWCEEK